MELDVCSRKVKENEWHEAVAQELGTFITGGRLSYTVNVEHVVS